MIKIDMWHNDNYKDANKIDVFFYPNNGEYRGNIYINNKMVGNYVCDNSAELEHTFSQLKFNW